MRWWKGRRIKIRFSYCLTCHEEHTSLESEIKGLVRRLEILSHLASRIKTVLNHNSKHCLTACSRPCPMLSFMTCLHLTATLCFYFTDSESEDEAERSLPKVTELEVARSKCLEGSKCQAIWLKILYFSHCFTWPPWATVGQVNTMSIMLI